MALTLNVVIKRRSSVTENEVHFSKNTKKVFLFDDLSLLLTFLVSLHNFFSYVPIFLQLKDSILETSSQKHVSSNAWQLEKAWLLLCMA